MLQRAQFTRNSQHLSKHQVTKRKSIFLILHPSFAAAENDDASWKNHLLFHRARLVNLLLCSYTRLMIVVTTRHFARRMTKRQYQAKLFVFWIQLFDLSVLFFYCIMYMFRILSSSILDLLTFDLHLTLGFFCVNMEICIYFRSRFLQTKSSKKAAKHSIFG